jgi:ribosomal peptide maturation radical SAM protein 1
MPKKFALISMPLQVNQEKIASLGVPIIARALRESDIETDVFLFDLHFARYLKDKGFDIGSFRDHYSFYYSMNAVFAELCWKRGYDKDQLRESLHLREEEAELVWGLKRHVVSFFERILASTDWGSYGAIGFSCSYFQVIASLYFSRLIKQKYPDVKVVLGGPFFEPDSPAEILKHESQIDYIAEGYADMSVAPLVKAILDGNTVEIAHIYKRGDKRERECEAAAADEAAQRMDRFGYPDFSDYARQYKRLMGADPVSFDVEISRGCQKSHSSPCLFCNENRFGRFTRKPVDYFAGQLRYYNKEFGVRQFNINDSLIDVRTLITYLRPLANDGFSYAVFGLFARISREEMKELAELHVRNMQAGIESLQNHLLTIMNKQNDVLNCINVLKWATYYGIFLRFNMLCKIPGERKDDYMQEIELIKKLHHLNPGRAYTRDISGKNDSPYLQKHNEYGVVRLGSKCRITDMFPEDYDRDKISSYFEISYPGKGDCDEIIDELIKEMQEWKADFEGDAKLTYEIDDSGCMTILDSRSGMEKEDFLDEAHSLILSLLDEPTDFSAIQSAAKKAESEIRTILSELIAKDYVYANDSDCFISLALPKK